MVSVERVVESTPALARCVSANVEGESVQSGCSSAKREEMDREVSSERGLTGDILASMAAADVAAIESSAALVRSALCEEVVRFIGRSSSDSSLSSSPSPSASDSSPAPVETDGVFFCCC